MDPIALATAAVSVLAPYLAKLSEIASKAALDQAQKKLESILAAVKKKTTGNVYAEETLKRLEEQPQSTSRQAALIGVLEEQIQADKAFADTLQKLIDEAKGSGMDFINQKVTVSGHARTGDITTVGKIEGDFDIRNKKK